MCRRIVIKENGTENWQRHENSRGDWYLGINLNLYLDTSPLD